LEDHNVTIEQAAQELKRDYLHAAARKQVVAIHLFGIRHAKALKGMPLKEILLRAEMPVSYGTEIRKGMRLAEFVTIKA
jgi:hypothetical protein